MNLAPNAGFAIRWMDYVPVEGNRDFFIVQIHERKSLRSKIYIRRYLVHEIQTNEEGRCFRMKKSLLAHKSENREEFYNVLIGPNPQCDCRGWSAHGKCCHVEVLVAWQQS